MLPGLDSRPPTDAQIAAAKAQGYRVWGLYHGIPGDGIDPGHLASDDDFRRVQAAGFTVIAYVSGNEDPGAIKSWAQRTGVLPVVDVERFIRSDGPWVPGWLTASGSGLYGNGSVHYDTSGFRQMAACHIFAGYYGNNPNQTWPGWLPHPGSAPLAWQFQGTTDIGIGLSVDLSWFDDSFATVFGPGGGQLFGGNRVSKVVGTSQAEGPGQWVTDGITKRGIADPVESSQMMLITGQSSVEILGRGYIDRIPDHPGGSAPVDLSPVLAAIAAIKIQAPTVDFKPVLDAIAALKPGTGLTAAQDGLLTTIGGDVATTRRLVEKDLAP